MTLLLLLGVPLFALQIALHARAPWWNLPLETIQILCLPLAGLLFFLGYRINLGDSWAFKAIQSVAVLWFALGLVLSLTGENFWLGLSSILGAATWILLINGIQKELRRSFFDPKMEWYQGVPKPIPTLKCRAQIKKYSKQNGTSQKLYPVRVSRIDRDGVFIFSDIFLSDTEFTRELQSLSRNDQFNLEFQNGEKRVRFEAKPVRMLENGKGVGLRFRNLASDSRKDLGDFVESLRGEGYVQ